MPKTKIGILTEDRYATLVSLVQGTFKVPVKERNAEQRRAVFQYKRWKKDLKINDEGYLTYLEKKVLKSGEEISIIKGEFTRNLGISIRSLFLKLRDRYQGITEQTIIRVLETSKRYNKLRPKFQNKPPPKTITAKKQGDR